MCSANRSIHIPAHISMAPRLSGSALITWEWDKWFSTETNKNDHVTSGNPTRAADSLVLDFKKTGGSGGHFFAAKHQIRVVPGVCSKHKLSGSPEGDPRCGVSVEIGVELLSARLFEFNHPAFVAPSTAAAAGLYLSLLVAEVGGRSSIDAALGTFQHLESSSGEMSPSLRDTSR